MGGQLVAIAGPNKDSVIHLGGAQLTLGRGGENHVQVPSSYVSRRHCVIECKRGRFKVRDLGSSNGTVVNGVPVKQRWLEHGDRLRIGDSLFVFLLARQETRSGSHAVQIEGGDLLTGSTIELPPERVARLQHQQGFEECGALEQPGQVLSALFKVSAAMSSASGLEALARRLLESILPLFGAERGAILLVRDGSDKPATILGMERGSGDFRQIQPTQNILSRVIREGTALLMNDLDAPSPSLQGGSSAGTSVCSALAVPLAALDGTLGILYLDSSDPAFRFAQRDLELLTAIAGIASVGLGNVKRLEEIERAYPQHSVGAQLKDGMVGESPAMDEVRDFIARVAPSEASILIMGETGTGKELVVKAIHQNSRRACGPYVAINCAALVETLLESELFGHEKGAFTGAIVQKKGKFELAHGGTLLLDEVAELSPALQAKLLRALEERQIERVGGTRPVPCDVRVVAATHRCLEEEVQEGRFRADLYYRLNVVSFKVPPLRERMEDMPLLANYFAIKYATACNRKIWGVSEEALLCLKAYSWPGNVRELENAIERAVILGDSDLIMPCDLPANLHSPVLAEPIGTAGLHGEVLEAKKQLVLRAFKEGRGSFVEAAKLLGIHRNSLHRLVRRLNLKEEVRPQR